MVAAKEIIVGSVLISLFALPAASLQFNVDVAGDADTATYEMKYKDSSAEVQEINVTAENVGSIGCEYRLKGKFSYNGSTETVYSQAEGIWPGDSKPLELQYIPYNYSGEVAVDLDIEYCGISENLDDFNYSSESGEFQDKSIGSSTLSSNSSSAVVSIDSEEAYLVPQNEPAGWKVASSKVEEGKARLDYEPSLFSKDKRISYRVVENGSVVGLTEVGLEPRKKLLEKIPGGVPGLLLGLSALLNLIFIAGKFRARN